MTITGPLHVTLGPLPCRECHTLVVFAVATQVFTESHGKGYVRRRDLFEAATELPHRCARQARVAA